MVFFLSFYGIIEKGPTRGGFETYLFIRNKQIILSAYCYDQQYSVLVSLAEFFGLCFANVVMCTKL